MPYNVGKYFKVYTSRGIVLGFCALVAVVVSTTIMQVRSINELKKLASQQQIVATNTSLLDDILLSTVNAETSQRGYLLTGNNVYLAPYTAALPKITVDFNKFKRMHETPQDATTIDTLHLTVNKKLSELQSTLDAMNTGDFSSAVAIVQTNSGLTLMNSVRSQVQSIERRQSTSLRQEQANVLNQINTYQSLLVVVRLSALVLVLLGMYLTGKALYERYELERGKGEFINIAAHQLRTPASVVKLNLSAILNGYMGRLPSEPAKAIRNAYESNEHAIAIIEDVLRVAKVDNGDTVLHKKPEHVQKLLDEVVISMKPTLKTRKQKVTKKFPKRPVYAALDPIYTRMVVENLIDNASKYSHERSMVTVDLESAGQKIFIRVTDTGVGIDRSDMSKLFKKFSRIESELSDSITGSGLGLYWSRQVAVLHGGDITVKSKKGKGSTFTLTLPILRYGSYD